MLELKNGIACSDFGEGAEAPCNMIFNRLHVTYQGYLTACCVDFNNMMAIADLNTTPLKSAWNSSEFIELRRQHLEKNIGNNMCYMCIHNVECENVMPLVPQLYKKVEM